MSVAIPTVERPAELRRALRSLLAQSHTSWEGLVVDAGDRPGVREAVADLMADPRLRWVTPGPSPAATARNAAVAEATGEVVAFLDDDNAMAPHHLARAVAELDEGAAWTLSGQVVFDGDRAHVWSTDRTLADLQRANFVDVNAIVVRRSVLAEVGPFDPTFVRMDDWDMALRLWTHAGPPVHVPAVGSVYSLDSAARLSDVHPFHPERVAVRRRFLRGSRTGLRVLVVAYDYPQQTVTYMHADLAGLRELGVHVEVWAQETAAVSMASDIPLHRGTLAEALEAVQPDLILCYWLFMAMPLHEQLKATGKPVVIHEHGFDWDWAHMNAVLQDPHTHVHVYPHHLDGAWPASRVTPMVTAFEPDLYPPARDKERDLVVRVGPGLLVKDYETFFELAKHCPDHRFVLIVGRSNNVEHEAEEIRQIGLRMESPVEVRIDVPQVEAAALVARAGTYVYTCSHTEPMGMPVSIAEAMATGCRLLTADLPGVRDYVGDAGEVFRDPWHAAELIRASTLWGEAEWAGVWRRSVEQAYSRHANVEVAEAMLDRWQPFLPR